MEDLTDLDSDFTEEEVKNAVWQLGTEKAPESNGFPLFFYRTFWKEMKDDVIGLLKGFAKGEGSIERINYSLIVLIPKKKTPQAIEDYRPITLLNSSLKIISKVLANRPQRSYQNW